MVSINQIDRVSEIINTHQTLAPGTVAGVILDEFRPYPMKLETGWAIWVALMILKQRTKRWPTRLIAERILNRIYAEPQPFEGAKP